MEGKICDETFEFDAKSAESKEIIIQNFADICCSIWNEIPDNEKTLNCIGIVFPGPFDYENGISQMHGLAKYEALYNVSLKESLKNYFNENNISFAKDGYSFKFLNDVEAYAIGVANYKNFSEGIRTLYLCIGTGSGSAYTIGTEITKNTNQGLPENGWIYPIPFKNSIIDDYISARGITNLSKKYFKKALSPLEVSTLYGKDPLAKLVFDEFGINLKDALSPLIEKFGANTFVLGGKISKSANYFLGPLEKFCKQYGIDIVIEPNTSKMSFIGISHILKNN